MDAVIAAVILAAGASSRMGRLKALLPAGADDTFLTRIVRTFGAAGVARVAVVLGHEAQQLSDHLHAAGLHPQIAINHGWEAGQLSSLLVGLEAVDAHDVEAVLLMLIDAPFVSPDTIRAVVDRFRATGAPIVRPVREDQHGHPVLIARALFPLLRAADPRTGAKSVVRAHVSAAGDVMVADPGAFMDIDTPADFMRATASARADDGGHAGR